MIEGLELSREANLLSVAIKHAVWEELKDQRLNDEEALKAVAEVFESHNAAKALVEGLRDYRRFLEICPVK